MRPSNGIISRVTCDESAGACTANSVKYWVKFNSSNGIVEIGPVKVCNRRPLDNLDLQIVPASVGDIVNLYWGDNNSVAVQVIEGIVTEQCPGSNNNKFGFTPKSIKINGYIP